MIRQESDMSIDSIHSTLSSMLVFGSRSPSRATIRSGVGKVGKRSWAHPVKIAIGLSITDHTSAHSLMMRIRGSSIENCRLVLVVGFDSRVCFRTPDQPATGDAATGDHGILRLAGLCRLPAGRQLVASFQTPEG